MYLAVADRNPSDRREFVRLSVQCRARIVIGPRHYAGYLHDISAAGAKLRTITPIGKLGIVLLRLPDLPPLKCKLRWTDSHNAGVRFETPLASAVLSDWARNRNIGRRHKAVVAELELAL